VATGEFDKDTPGRTYVAFSPDGKQLASVHFEDGLIHASYAICLWNVTADNKLNKAATLQVKKNQNPGYRESLYYLTFSPDSKLLAAREPDDSTVIWDTTSGKERLRLDTKGIAVTFTPDGRTLITVTRYGLVEHWDLATKKCVYPQDGAKREEFLFVVNAIASSDGKTLAVWDDYSVVFKDAHSGRTLRRFDNLQWGCLALSPDGKTFAATKGSKIVLFDRETGKELAQLNMARDSWVRVLAFSPDAKSLALAAWEPMNRETVSVWEISKFSPVSKEEVKSPSIPLEARLTSKKDSYPLTLDGKTPEEFARQVRSGSLPPSPKVDLVLTLRNTGTKTLTFNPDIHVSLYLIGVGAMNHPWKSYQTEGRPSDEPKMVTLAPGKTYEVIIQSLDCDHAQQSYWLLPGEYTLHASCWFRVEPAPVGADKFSDGSGYVDLKAPPLRVKVEAEKQ
jgi:WD40 repeat protein